MLLCPTLRPPLPVPSPRLPSRLIGANPPILLLEHPQKTAADAPRCIHALLTLYHTGWTVARQRATQRMRSCGVSPAAANMGSTHRWTLGWPLTRRRGSGRNVDHRPGLWAPAAALDGGCKRAGWGVCSEVRCGTLGYRTGDVQYGPVLDVSGASDVHHCNGTFSWFVYGGW